MSVFFFDTSAVVKRYVVESGTAWIRSLCGEGDLNSIFISEIAVVEGAAAELTQRHPLKAYDAMQLAFGLHINSLFRASNQSLVFVTADETLLLAARAEGIVTENPVDHE